MRGSRRALSAALLCAASVAAIRDTGFSESLFVEEAATRVPKGIMTGEGWICQDIEDVTKVQHSWPQVQEFMAGHGLLDEYELLQEALRQAPKGRFRNWKASALDRALFLEGEKPNSFHAKGVHAVLVKAWGLWRSQFKICFWTAIGGFEGGGAFLSADIARHVYEDGGEVQVACRHDSNHPYEMKNMDEGVAGQGLYHGKRSQPEEMTNEVFKLLYKKGALPLHEEYGARILSRPKNNLLSTWHVNQANWDILITRVFKQRFAAQGIGISFNQQGSQCRTHIGWPGLDIDTRSVTWSWLEYADYNITGESYLPSTSIFESWWHIRAITLWAMCHRNPAVSDLAAEADLKSTITTQPACQQVVGGWRRNSVPYPGCKCPHWQQVRCGEHFVGERKFDINALMERPECKVGNMYCGRRGCKGL